MRVWRIATEGREYSAEDLSGKGAESSGGRWNRVGLPVVYAAESIALACLETVVHVAGGLPLNRYLVRIEIPEHLWQAREHPAAWPAGWDARPEGKASLDFGDDWLKSGRSLILIVPSVIVPEECVVLINPRHPDASMVKAVNERRWDYDPRIR